MEEKLKIYKIKEGIYIAFCDDDSNEQYRYGFIIYSKENQFFSLGSVRNWKTPSFSEDFIWDENYICTRLFIYDVIRDKNFVCTADFPTYDEKYTHRHISNIFDINNKCDVVSEIELQKLREQYISSKHPDLTEISEEEKETIRLILEK